MEVRGFHGGVLIEASWRAYLRARGSSFPAKGPPCHTPGDALGTGKHGMPVRPGQSLHGCPDFGVADVLAPEIALQPPQVNPARSIRNADAVRLAICAAAWEGNSSTLPPCPPLNEFLNEFGSYRLMCYISHHMREPMASTGCTTSRPQRPERPGRYCPLSDREPRLQDAEVRC